MRRQPGTHPWKNGSRDPQRVPIDELPPTSVVAMEDVSKLEFSTLHGAPKKTPSFVSAKDRAKRGIVETDSAGHDLKKYTDDEVSEKDMEFIMKHHGL